MFFHTFFISVRKYHKIPSSTILSPLQIRIGSIYGWYCAIIKEHRNSKSKVWPYDIKMTFLLNLSEEPYEGGDFIIDKKPQPFFREPGTAILFKSYIKHEVTPVTKGERISLSYFMCGPKFQ